MKISIFVKIYEKSRFWSTFSENVDFSQYIRKSWIGSKFSPNLGFGQIFEIFKISNFQKTLILVNFLQKTPLGSNFSKILISVEIIVKT